MPTLLSVSIFILSLKWNLPHKKFSSNIDPQRYAKFIQQLQVTSTLTLPRPIQNGVSGRQPPVTLPLGSHALLQPLPLAMHWI